LARLKEEALPIGGASSFTVINPKNQRVGMYDKAYLSFDFRLQRYCLSTTWPLTNGSDLPCN
jgi:hypothetical protein